MISDDDLAKDKSITVEQVRLLRESRGATNSTLQGMKEGALRRAIRRLDYPDLPRARQQQLLAISRDDAGQVQPGALARALIEVSAMRRRLGATTRCAGVPTQRVVRPKALVGAAPGLPAGEPVVAPAAGLSTSSWVWLGPGNIGGRTRSVVIHPTQPQKMWAASAGGGIWHTQDGGAHWQPVDDMMANLAICCLAIDRKKPNILYAGSGEGFNNLDAIRGAGVFRTTDGVTWKQLAATANADFLEVNRLAVSPSGTVVLAGTNSGLFRSRTATRKTWTKVLTEQIADVKFHPRLNTRAVAAGLQSGEAYFSTDGGRTWQAAAHAQWSGRVELAYAVADPRIVYASVQMTHGELWRSTDGGRSYQRCGNLNPDGQPAAYLGDQGWYDNAVWAGDPRSASLVLVGGIDLWRSDDGGDTLREISTWWDNGSAHADHHAIVSHPAYDGVANRCVFFGNDGGVYQAADIDVLGSEAQPPYTAGWTELVNNYGVTQFYGAAGHAASGKIVGGAQDNGTLCYDPASGTEQWTSMFGGDGGWCAADPNDANVLYGEYVYLNIHRNLDGGASSDTTGDRYISGQFWNPAIGEWSWKPVPFRIPDAMNRRAMFIAPFVLDPNNANRLLAGGLSLWETANAKAPNTTASGPSWRAIKPSAGDYITAIAVSTGDSARVWVGHRDGKVFCTTNGTAVNPVWRRCDGVGVQPLLAARYCTAIAVHPTDAQTAYVAFGGFVNGNVWKTQDHGATWTDHGGGLPAAPVRAIAIHPRRTDAVYVGTEVGVFASEDGGVSWSPTNEGPANVSVNCLFWMGETLVCATHGRGMFKIDLSTL